MSNIDKKRKEFSAKELHVIEWLANPQDKRTNKQIHEEVGIATRTVTEWKKRPDILEAVYDRVMQQVGLELPRVMESMVLKAIHQQDVNAAKLVLKAAGKIDRDHSANALKGVQINLNTNIPRPDDEPVEINEGGGS